MFQKDEVEAFKNAGYSFEEIQKIESGISSIQEGETYSQEEVKNYIENELFGKYKIHV